jgi:hypothetical protein
LNIHSNKVHTLNLITRLTRTLLSFRYVDSCVMRLLTGFAPIMPACPMMPNRPLSLRQADQARADLYAIHDELEFLRTQLARLPTRQDIARLAMLAMTGGAGLAI